MVDNNNKLNNLIINNESNIETFNQQELQNKKPFKMIKCYKLYEGFIGKGACGEVYIGLDTIKNSLVAIKAIKNTKLSNDNLMKAFKREISLLNELRHPNIIRIYSVEKTINNIYMALEYCNGGTLASLKDYYHRKYKTGIPEGLVQRIIIQLSEGIYYMHQKRVMHRDLKLDNIMLNYPYNKYKKTYEEYEQNNYDGMQIKIADLGYARDIAINDCVSTFCGTPITIAPDIIGLNYNDNFNNENNNNNNNKGYNLKADIWSLGAITYEMLIGIPPFIDSGLNEVLAKIKEGVYKYPKNCIISVEAITFINGLLTFDPSKRFDTKDIKNHPFLINDPKNFNPLSMDVIPPESIDAKTGELEVNSKDINSFLWCMFKPKNNDKDIKSIKDVVTEDLKNEDLMKSICVVPSNLRDEKRDLLSRFRKGRSIYNQNINNNNKINEVDNNNINNNINNNSYNNKNITKEEDTIETKNNNIEKTNELRNNIENIEINNCKEDDNNNQEEEDIYVNWDTYSIVDNDDEIEVSSFSDININFDYINMCESKYTNKM